MKRICSIIILSILSLSVFSAWAEEAGAKYDKFISNEKLVRTCGAISLYKSGKDIYMEVSDTLIGKRLLLSTVVVGSGDLDISIGKELSSRNIYTITKRDSSIIFTSKSRNYLVEDGDTDVINALKNSNTEVIRYVLPIKYQKEGKYIFKANSLFSASNKDIVHIGRLGYYKDYSLSANSKFLNDISLDPQLRSFKRGCAVSRLACFELELITPGISFVLSEKPICAVEIQTSYSIIDEDINFIRYNNDKRIGVRSSVQFTRLSGNSGSRSDSWACRWNLDKGPITFYLDTLFTPIFAEHITQGIKAWNEAFTEIGLGECIQVKKYNEAEEIDVCDPTISKVFYVPYGESVGLSVLIDKSSSEIISCNIMIPIEYVSRVRKNAPFQIAATDDRFNRFDIPETAIAQMLRAEIMRTTGLALGLSNNAAGAKAYSPEQILSPEFTQKHGFVSSVMDDVLFNYLASAEDRSKGVVTVSQRIGSYDKYAIDWLYGKRNEEERREFISEHIVNPEYFYFPSTEKANMYCNRLVLGNDLDFALQAAMSQLKHIASTSASWLKSDSVPTSYRQLFLDFLFLRMFHLSSSASERIGAMKPLPFNSGAGGKHFETISEIEQKSILNQIVNIMSELDWVNGNKELMNLSDVNKDITQISLTQIPSLLLRRVYYVQLASSVYGAQYTLEEYLTDINKVILDLSLDEKGYKSAGEALLFNYIYMLLRTAPEVVVKNFNKNIKSKSINSIESEQQNSITEYISTNAYPSSIVPQTQKTCYVYLGKFQQMLKDAQKRTKCNYTKASLDYYIGLIEAARKNKC